VQHKDAVAQLDAWLQVSHLVMQMYHIVQQQSTWFVYLSTVDCHHIVRTKDAHHLEADHTGEYHLLNKIAKLSPINPNDQLDVCRTVDEQKDEKNSTKESISFNDHH